MKRCKGCPDILFTKCVIREEKLESQCPCPECIVLPICTTSCEAYNKLLQIVVKNIKGIL